MAGFLPGKAHCVSGLDWVMAKRADGGEDGSRGSRPWSGVAAQAVVA